MAYKNKLQTVAEIGPALYKQHIGTDQYVHIFSSDLPLSTSHDMFDLQPISNTEKLFPRFVLDLKYKVNGKLKNFGNRTGAYILSLKKHPEKKVIFLSHISPMNKRLYNYYIGLKDDYFFLFDKASFANSSLTIPKKGLFKIRTINHGHVHSFISEKFKTPEITTIHPQTNIIKEYIQTYFDNINTYVKNNKSGKRTLLIYGVPGTGKTTLLNEIAEYHKKDKLILFCDNLQTLCLANKKAAELKRPIISILEDSEIELQNETNVKNFLSGNLEIRNVSGSIYIFTTNYPNLISKTIIKRRGRIDRLFNVDKLSNSYLIECFKCYLDKETFINVQNDLQNHFKDIKLSGAEISGIVEEAKLIADSDIIPLNINHIKDAYNNMSDEIKKINEVEEELDYAKEFDIAGAQKKSLKIGFN
jgi:ABC-type dipeptide/oligopeptide/nickel transport system ATPase subunit